MAGPLASGYQPVGWTPPDFTQPTKPLDLRRESTPSIPEWDPGADKLNAAAMLPGTDWDRIRIGGVRLKAYATVEGDKDTKIDVKEIPGADGANLTQLGTTPAPIVIRLRCFTTDAVDEWMGIAKRLQPVPGRPTPEAVDVYHPALAVNGVKSLYLKTLGVPTVRTPGGPVEIVTRWIEFLPVKQRAPKTIGSSQSNIGNVKKAGAFAKKKPSEHGVKP